MWQLISDMMASPEDHADAYVWGAALLGHFAIGVFLTALIGGAFAMLARLADIPRLTAWQAALVASVSYALLWEGAQAAFYGAGLADSLVDALAVLCGAVVAAGAWRNRGAAVALAFAVLAAIGVAGVRRRK
ncbi:hypothetical protein Shpa_23 [Paracoccus phage Shpa]|uniref:Uncharacterized protein n=1 Tax=Paracoccus phage Shpa TaxID=1647282 RepID=A0A0U2BXE1_9CAUD|nr:hypothetical protein FDG85_gp23 [Paracoccus phage Shpa]AKG94534.1 hypothetical protein Shpa_23 [Paracoccus phage Shpa]